LSSLLSGIWRAMVPMMIVKLVMSMLI